MCPLGSILCRWRQRSLFTREARRPGKRKAHRTAMHQTIEGGGDDRDDNGGDGCVDENDDDDGGAAMFI